MSFTPGSDFGATLPLIKVPHQDVHSVATLSSYLRSHLERGRHVRPTVIVCIGTDRSTGDSLGPLIGSRLADMNLSGVHLFGTLDEPVHAMNLQETVSGIEDMFIDPFVLAIDACLGQISSVGHIQLGVGPLKPGAGVNKDLPAVGDIHMTGIVNVGGFMEYFVLQNTRLSLVMKMSEIMAQSIVQAVTAVRSAAPTREWEPERLSLPLDR